MGLFSKKISKRIHPGGTVNWTEYFHGTSSSKSGATVTESTVMGLPAVWAGVNFISTTKAALPLHVHRKTVNGSEIATGHIVDKILSVRPNPYQDPFKFIETCCNFELLTGFCYCEKIYTESGKLSALFPIPTWRVEGPIDHEGERFYRVTLKTGQAKYLPENKMLKIEGPYGGVSILGLMKETFGLSLAIDEFANNFFGQGTNPGVVIKHPKTLTPDGQKKLQTKLRNIYSGLGSSFRLMLLDEGMEAQKLLHSLEENQLIGLKQFQITDVARILNLPPHILKDLSKSSFSNIETQSIELVIYSLLPRVKRYESVFNTFLLEQKDQGEYFVKFNLKGLMRGDDAARAEFYTKMRRLGIYSINDIRRLEDENSIGKIGDQYHISADLIPLDMAGVKSEQKSILKSLVDAPETAFTSKRAEYLPLFVDALQGVVNREVAAIKKNIKSDNFENWLDDFYENLPEVIRQKTETTIKAFSIGCMGGDHRFDVENYMEIFSHRFVNESIDYVLNTANPDALFDNMNRWHESKAQDEAEKMISDLENRFQVTK